MSWLMKAQRRWAWILLGIGLSYLFASWFTDQNVPGTLDDVLRSNRPF